MPLRIAPHPLGAHPRGRRRALLVLTAGLVATVGLSGCVGDLPPPTAAGDGTVDAGGPPLDAGLDAGRPDDAGRFDADLDQGPPGDGEAPDADRPDQGDAVVPADAQILDFNPIADVSPGDQDVLALVGVADTYTLAGACPLVVGAENGLLANDGVPAEATAVLDQFDNVGARLVRLDPDGGFEVDPGGPVNVSFTYRLVVDGQRSAPIAVDLRQPPRAIVVNTERDIADAGGLCSLRWAVRAALENLPVQGCMTTDEPGTDTIVFANPTGTYTFDHQPDPNPNPNPPPDPGRITVAGGSIAILGCGADQTIIDAAYTDSLFDVALGASLELRNLTLQHGESTRPGGALRIQGTVELAGVVVRENQHTGPSGGIGSALVQNFTPNVGGGGGIGGAIHVGSGARLTAYGTTSTCVFERNLVTGGAGGGGIGASLGQYSATQGDGGRGGGSGGGAGGLAGGDVHGRAGTSGGGGGGGAGTSNANGNGRGGPGGFGGGGGGYGALLNDPSAGQGRSEAGFGGGRSGGRACNRSGPGGGGGGFGGAIYNDGGTVEITGCRFVGNVANGGAGGHLGVACAGGNPMPLLAETGQGIGANIFTRGRLARTVLTEVISDDPPGAFADCRELQNCPN